MLVEDGDLLFKKKLHKERALRKNLTVGLLRSESRLSEFLADHDEASVYFALAELSELPYCRNLPSDELLIESLAAICSQETDLDRFLPVWMAAHLYLPPHKIKSFLNVREFLLQAPISLLHVILRLLLRRPLSLVEENESDLYFHYFKRLLAAVLAVAWQAEDERSEIVVATFIRFYCLVPLYFADQDLRQIAEMRARIIEKSKSKSFPDIKFIRNQLKYRVGIFIPTISRRSETMVALPYFKDFKSPRFSIHVFTVHSEVSKEDIIPYVINCDSVSMLPQDHEICLDEIRKAKMDIMVFVTNLSAVHNLFVTLAMQRLAPIQIVETCSPITTGLKEIDYYLSGSFTEPPGAEKYYSEALILMPGPAQAYAFLPSSDSKNCGQVHSRGKLAIPDDAVVFVSGANLNKITPKLRRLWARILADTPNAYFLLYPFNHNWQKDYPVTSFMESLKMVGQNFGVDADHWTVLKPLPSRDALLSVIALGNVYLDSMIHSGAVSLLDPLQVGMPMVVIEGRYGRGRQASAIMRSLGLDEYICHSEEEYVALALGLARDPGKRLAFTESIHQALSRNPIIFDCKRYAQEFEKVLLRIVDRHDG